MIHILVTKAEVKKFMSRRKIADPKCDITFVFHKDGDLNDVKGVGYPWRSKKPNRDALDKLKKAAAKLKVGVLSESDDWEAYDDIYDDLYDN